MARTTAGATLTREHHRSQGQIRALALRNYLRLWPLWRGDERSFAQLVDATIPLVVTHHRLASSLSVAYYEAFRRAERAAGAATPRPAPPLDEDRVVASLHVTGRVMTAKALLAGQNPKQAMTAALTRTSGALTRHVLAGGRDALVLSTGEDRQAHGWARVTSRTPCAFCAMLASRGAAYRGEDTAEFEAHDHCACTAEPAYPGAVWPGRAREFRQLWNAHAAASENPLNAFRLALAAAADDD